VSWPRTVLVTGGVRAGKSAFALVRAGELAAPGARAAFVATAEAGDAEMAARIARHRRERPAGWLTIEAPLLLPDALAKLDGRAEVVVVDCLTLWVANLLGRDPGLGDEALGASARELVAVLDRRLFHAVVVSNEVGWGVHPETPLGRRFRDALGTVNQAVARAADEVALVVAGCPVWLKGRLEAR
jgi:adenosyl cobinamide kinase/adenosyl cobinamide phosphate guanylyltransferase